MASIDQIAQPASAEQLESVKYTHRSFELVYGNFCAQYSQKLAGNDIEQVGYSGFMGLPAYATTEDMQQRLEGIAEIMGDPPKWSPQELAGAEIRTAILKSARHLAWQSMMGSFTQHYVDRLKGMISEEKQASNGLKTAKLRSAFEERDTKMKILLAQNHAIRDYFDSDLAKMLGNDSPAHMLRLLGKNPYSVPQNNLALARGLSLEIAAKRSLEAFVKLAQLPDTQVAFGNDEQDARGGDLVIVAPGQVTYVDLKSSVPTRFADGSTPTEADYERHYRWLNPRSQNRQLVVWASGGESPVSPNSFEINDRALLRALAKAVV